MKDYAYNKGNLAAYFNTLYSKIYETDISPVKLHKALYFAYAFWGKYINSLKNNNEISEIEGFYNKAPEELFEANFEAWTYGPVEVDIYKKVKENPLSKEVTFPLCLCNLKYESEVRMVVDEVARRIFRTSDFGLIDVSCAEPAWKIARESEDKKMHFKDIIETEVF